MVSFSPFYPSPELGGVKGTTLPPTRNVPRGEWTALPNPSTMSIGDTVTYMGSSFTVVTAHIKSSGTAAPPTNPAYQILAQAGSGGTGSSTYTWFAYADSADGATNFTTGDAGDRRYIGIAANKDTLTEGTNPGDYSWTRIQGNAGPAIVITPTQAAFQMINGVLNPNPQTIGYSATLQNIAGTINWTTSPNIKSGTGTTFSISSDEMGTQSRVLVTATVGTVSQTMILMKQADPTADPTNANVAAGIIGQAPTATNSNYDAITGENKPENKADVTSYISSSVSEIIIQTDTNGAAKTNQLPRDVSFKLIRNGVQITSDIIWVYRVLTGSVNGLTSSSGYQPMTGAGTGGLPITSVGPQGATVEITASYAGTIRTLPAPFAIITKPDTPPVGGGGSTGGGGTPSGGGSSAAITTFASTGTGITYDSFNQLPNISTGSAGTIDFTAPLTFSVMTAQNTSSHMFGKWQYRTVGAGTWIDAGPEIQSAYPATRYNNGTQFEPDPVIDPGYIAVNQSVSGLTANTAYETRIILRDNNTGFGCYIEEGTATASGA